MRRVCGHIHLSQYQGCPPHSLLFGDRRYSTYAGTNEADESNIRLIGFDNVTSIGHIECRVAGRKPLKLLLITSTVDNTIWPDNFIFDSLLILPVWSWFEEDSTSVVHVGRESACIHPSF